MRLYIIALSILISIGNLAIAQGQDTIGLGGILYEEPKISSSTATSELLLNNISFQLLQMHITLAGIGGNASPNEATLTTIKEMEDLVKTDIIQAIGISTNRQETLQNYITRTATALEKGNTAIAFLQQELSLLTMDMNGCSVDKAIADKLYFDSVNTYDQASADVALQESIKNNTCASEKRISYNAKVYLLNKLNFYQGLLQEKYLLVFDEQETLIQHFDVISDSMLQKLQAINDTLNRYQF